MADVLVLANETIGGQKLLDAIRERNRRGDAHFHFCVPVTQPKHGNVVYDEAVRDGAQVRVDLARSFARDEGIDASGEIGDQDPFNAALDVLRERRIDEIIVSTLPAGQSAWLRRDLIQRLRETTGLPVSHVVVDLAADGLPFDVTLVVANLTASSPELVERLRALANESPHRFIAVVPQDHGRGEAAREARERLAALVEALEREGIVAAGMIGDPDPYTATLTAVQYFHLSEIIISTLPEGTSRWVADKLVERVKQATNLPVEHIESTVGAEA